MKDPLNALQQNMKLAFSEYVSRDSRKPKLSKKYCSFPVGSDAEKICILTSLCIISHLEWYVSQDMSGKFWSPCLEGHILVVISFA